MSSISTFEVSVCPFPIVELVFFSRIASKKTTFSPIQNGRWISFLKSWTARILPTLLIPRLPKDSRHSNVKKKSCKTKDTTIVIRPSYVFPNLIETHLKQSFVQFDSEDEREAREAQIALGHKIKSQSIKKSKKNQARLPRTAGLRTLSELTTELTNAGYNTSQIQQRAEMIAKIQGAKRKRDEADDSEEDVDMDRPDLDDAHDDADAEEGWMDVDEDERSPHKKLKTDAGSARVVSKRGPRSNRQLAGLRDDAVRPFNP